jgi:hypothetical protein
MSVAHATIDAGVCGFTTEVDATCEDGMMVRLDVQSPCENIQGLSARLPELNAFAEIGSGFDGELHKTVRAALKGCCSGCVVPVGLFKAMQVAAGLALPRPVAISLNRIEE